MNKRYPTLRRPRVSLRLLFFSAAVVVAACAPKTVPAAEVQQKVQAAFEQKMRWILQLEDERQLRGGGGDLLALLNDAEPRIRRRAALAAGRVKLPDALAPLTSLLQSDPDSEVRHMAAFALGLIGDASAAPALTE